MAASMCCVVLSTVGRMKRSSYYSTRKTKVVTRSSPIKRTRKKVKNLMYELGGYSRRYYRMEKQSFWKLHDLLKDKITYIAPASTNGTSYNGPIHSSLRLSIAIRYFAGGDPMDIALVHGVSHASVFVSIWAVVDAIHTTPDLNITFPEDHGTQLQIAKDFHAKSEAGFHNCAGAIDGILIWINCPTETECNLTQCGKKSSTVDGSTNLV